MKNDNETEKKDILKSEIQIKAPAVKQRISFKEDPSFGQRLNFSAETRKSESNQMEEKLEIAEDKSGTFKKKQMEYNRLLRRDPTDINLWLEFCSFQDEIHNFENTKWRKIVERKISILKKAVEFNSSCLALTLEHLKLAEEVEDSCTLLKLWEGYLKKSRNLDSSFVYGLTRKYLKFREQRFLAFSFDQVNEAFSDAFINLKELCTIDNLIPLYKEYFDFLKRGGFIERAVALLQALIEVNIEKFNYGQVDLDAYEDQCDFGLMQHIGDRCITEEEVSLYPEEFDKGSASILQKWIQLEKYREMNFWHPKQQDSSVDLEGQIIFDDLRNFIPIIKERDDILPFLKGIIFEFGKIFIDNCNNYGFLEWYCEVYGTLFPFYKNNDWEFTFNYFRALDIFDREEAENLCKKLLSENRDSLELFFAYGRFQEYKGNSQMAEKVYESLRKRSPKYEERIQTPADDFYESQKPTKLEFNLNDLKADVYELVRMNPGDKYLYMRIIEKVEPINNELAMEIFNLIDEQQLRMRSFLEEV